MEVGRLVLQPIRARRVQGSGPRDPGPGGLLAPQARVWGPPRAKGSGHGVGWAHPHLDGNGRRPPRSRRCGRPGQPRRPRDRRVPLLRARWPERQYHRLGRSGHPQADGHRDLRPGGALAATKPREGHALPPGPVAEAGPGRAAARGGGDQKSPGGNGGALGEDTDLQLPPEPSRALGAQPPGDPGGGSVGRIHRRPAGRGAAEAARGDRRRFLGAMRPTDLIRRSAAYLEGHGVESPRETAEALLMHFLHTDRAGLYTRTHGLDTKTARLFGRALCQRCHGVPLQYLTGEQQSLDLVLGVAPVVFVPRPETEVLVERALETLDGRRDPVVADVGTGTGAVALAIKRRRLDATVYATDRSEDAVAVARANASRHALDMEVLCGDVVQPLRRELAGTVDVLVSNPPYVTEEEYESL